MTPYEFVFGDMPQVQVILIDVVVILTVAALLTMLKKPKERARTQRQASFTRFSKSYSSSQQDTSGGSLDDDAFGILQEATRRGVCEGVAQAPVDVEAPAASHHHSGVGFAHDHSATNSPDIGHSCASHSHSCSSHSCGGHSCGGH